MWCVFILSLLLLQPQPSLIISSEKVTDVPELLLSVTTQHPQYAVMLFSCNDLLYLLLQLSWSCFLLNAFLLVLFTAFAIIQEGKKKKSQHPVSAHWPWNPSALVLQSITTYCKEAFCSQASVCPPSFLSLSSLSVYQDRCLECLFCLYLSVSPASPRSPAFIHLCSHVCECVCVCVYVFLLLPLSAPALCRCVSAVEVILLSLLILSIAIPRRQLLGLR